MLNFLNRIRAVQRLVKNGRAAELDRLLRAMEAGARFKGASGVMLLMLANDHGWCEFRMRGAGSRLMLTDDLLGAAYERKIRAYLNRTISEDPFDDSAAP